VTISLTIFLFETRSGFCAHYAGAMTFVLRAAGIPARVVAGYQGGEVNPAGNYLSVHQFDAHAWVEYWVAERGWVSVDPTFQVAPERVEQGLEQALARERSFLADQPMSLLRYRDIGWVNTLRLRWDSLNYGWQRWVLNYQGEQQTQMLQRWLGKLDAQTLGLGLVAILGVLTAVLALFLFKPWRREIGSSSAPVPTLRAAVGTPWRPSQQRRGCAQLRRACRGHAARAGAGHPGIRPAL